MTQSEKKSVVRFQKRTATGFWECHLLHETGECVKMLEQICHVFSNMLCVFDP